MRDYQTRQLEGLNRVISRDVAENEKEDKTLNRQAAGTTSHHAVEQWSGRVASNARHAYDSGFQRSVLHAQRTFGNRHVQRMMSIDGAAEPAASSETVERVIQQQSAGGNLMDHGVRARMEDSFGADFGAVRIHNDPGSHELSRALDARAFTTGHDIFFSENSYEPGSSSGLELLAHELTHVVQQKESGIQKKLNVSEPGDPEEQEADAVARAVVARQQAGSPGRDNNT